MATEPTATSKRRGCRGCCGDGDDDGGCGGGSGVTFTVMSLS